MPNLIANINPLTKLAVMVAVTSPLFLSLDWVSAAVSTALTLALAPVCGVTYAQLARSSWPLAIIAPLSGVSMLLYGASGGEVYFSFGPAVISQNSIVLAVAVTVRVFAVALPVIVLTRGIDLTELGDACGQILRLPATFVLGTLAGVRMIGLVREDRRVLAQARRARGLGDRGRLAQAGSVAFGVLVAALRRSGRLATSLEARGLGRTPPGGRSRTWARASALGAKDAVVLAVALAVGCAPQVCAALAGTWRFLGL